MVLIRAIVRPEKVSNVTQELLSADFRAVTKMSVFGRGRQKGIKIGDLVYDEIPKEMLMIVCKREDAEDAIRVIMDSARTGENGNYGDGRIFVSPVEAAYTVSTGKKGL
ncbi:MAG: P-II family nitrogen regulator [Coriobacteriales bacterium]|jgi:nitrogen regulatory protein PII 1|nr:P-II family nitrogen regulator [Coriobacteriales bacterium]